MKTFKHIILSCHPEIRLLSLPASLWCCNPAFYRAPYSNSSKMLTIGAIPPVQKGVHLSSSLSTKIQYLHAARLAILVQIYDQLDRLYDDPPCPLNHDNPFQLLCSVILSSQVYHLPCASCAPMLKFKLVQFPKFRACLYSAKCMTSCTFLIPSLGTTKQAI